MQGGAHASGYNRTMGGPGGAGREPELVRSRAVVNRRACRARDRQAATAAAQEGQCKSRWLADLAAELRFSISSRFSIAVGGFTLVREL